MKEKVRENVGWILNVCEFWQHFLSFLIIRKQQDFFYFHIMIRMELEFSVPLFFMISGALMLNRISEPLKQLWHHRIFHMCYMASTFQEKMPAMSYAFLYCGVIFICSYVVTAIIRKIPILKKIVS